MYNHGKEFLNNAIEENIIENEYCIKFKCATTENPQENQMIEQIHRAIDNLIHSFYLQNYYFGEDEPWSIILAATAFVFHIM